MLTPRMLAPLVGEGEAVAEEAAEAADAEAPVDEALADALAAEPDAEAEDALALAEAALALAEAADPVDAVEAVLAVDAVEDVEAAEDEEEAAIRNCVSNSIVVQIDVSRQRNPKPAQVKMPPNLLQRQKIQGPCMWIPRRQMSMMM